MPSSETTRRRWLAYLLSTEPADRPRAERAIHDLYVAAEVEAPFHFCWFDSPAAACWAVAVLIESRQPHWADILAAARRITAKSSWYSSWQGHPISDQQAGPFT
jgi:hypothetical protein